MIGVGLGVVAKRRYSGFPFALRSFWQRVRDDSGTMVDYNTSIALYRIEPNALLALSASAYKTGKIYSVIPTDGSGDFTVVRAGTKDIIDKNGDTVTLPENTLAPDYSTGEAAWKITTEKITLNDCAALIGDTIIINTAFSSPTVVHLLGYNMTVEADEIKVIYSTTEIKHYKNGVLVSTQTGTFDWSGMDSITLGSFDNNAYLNDSIKSLILL
jgi:hypothetical protein